MHPRILQLHHNTVNKLKKLKAEAEQAGEYRVAKRIHTVLLNSSGHTSGSIAHLLNSPRSRVSEWIKIYEEHGYDGLLEGYRSGRPRELDEKQKIILSDIIDSGPISYGYLSGVWTSIMLTEVIAEEFNIFYHPGHVRKILYSMKYSLQRPKRVLANADPVKQNHWKRYTYPNIKKKPKD
jgi:transposase